MRKPEGADLLVSRLAIFAQMLSGLQTGIAMLLQEAQEIFALDEVQLAGLAGLGGNLVGRSGDSSVQPEYLTRLRNLKNQRLAVTGGGGHLHPPFAQHVNSAGHLSFHEKDGTLWIGGGVLDFVERFEGRAG